MRSILLLLAGGADRWEPKGRGRGGPEPLRHGPHEGYPDRWVNPADAMRPRGDKWGPAEGEHASGAGHIRLWFCCHIPWIWVMSQI
jgi:hypothetical protein